MSNRHIFKKMVKYFIVNKPLVFTMQQRTRRNKGLEESCTEVKYLELFGTLKKLNKTTEVTAK